MLDNIKLECNLVKAYIIVGKYFHNYFNKSCNSIVSLNVLLIAKIL